MNKAVIVGIVVAAAIIGGGLASPLFYETEINEALPVALNDLQEGLTLEEFGSMDEESRIVLVDAMPENIKDMIMSESAGAPRTVSEGMDEDGVRVLKTGQFVGLAGHRAEGDAKLLDVSGATYVRFENFEVTNGPDLRVYATQGGDVKQGIHLEKLKGSTGAQNYLLEGIDTDVYDTIVIYCQPFGVYFGEAVLS